MEGLEDLQKEQQKIVVEEMPSENLEGMENVLCSLVKEMCV